MSSPDILAAVGGLAESARPQALIYLAVFARMSAIVLLMPGVGERVTPIRAKLAAVFAITLITAPMTGRPPDEMSAIGLILSEVANGTAIGFALRCAVFVLQIAGSIIAQTLSLSLAFGSDIGFEQDSAFATLLIMGGLAAASASGVHFQIAAALIDAYRLFPIGVLPGGEAMGEWSALRAAGAFSAALGLSLPFVAMGFAYALAIALANKAMAQLPATFVGAPIIALAGLVLFASTASVILAEWLIFYRRLLDFEALPS
jgi:flagellar biosynthetic protein FliR